MSPSIFGIVMGSIFAIGGIGLVALSVAMRPLDKEIAAMEKNTEKLKQETAIIVERTARFKKENNIK